MSEHLATAGLLELWEATSGATPARRALALLAAACPGTSAEELAALPLGAASQLQATAAVAGQEHVVAVALEVAPHQVGEALVVLHHQDPSGARGTHAANATAPPTSPGRRTLRRWADRRDRARSQPDPNRS